jgi:hypothetical protein
VVLFNKIVDALLVSNYLNAVEVEAKPGRVGVAEYKLVEAAEQF